MIKYYNVDAAIFKEQNCYRADMCLRDENVILSRFKQCGDTTACYLMNQSLGIETSNNLVKI
jgi:hypothetical protein